VKNLEVDITDISVKFDPLDGELTGDEIESLRADIKSAVYQYCTEYYSEIEVKISE